MTTSDDPPIRARRLEQFRPEVTRRGFMHAMGASFGLAGLSACVRAPDKEILPYSRQPPEVTPGVAKHYATSMSIDGYATGLLVESHEGRPTKVEGNPDHPASLGATGIHEQGMVLSLYDPSRARAVARGGQPARWAAFANAHATMAAAKVHFLLEPTSSPLRVNLIGRIREAIPGATFHFHAPLSRNRAWDGAALAFGRPLDVRYDLSLAKVVLAVDRDFLASGPGWLVLARQFADGRRLLGQSDSMNRLYVAETALTVTGTAADHRLALRPSQIVALTALLAERVLAGQRDAPPELLGALERAASPAREHAAWAAAVARDLLANRGAGVVMVGDAQPPAVHAIVHAMNIALGNVDRTVRYAPPPIFEAGEASHDLGGLVGALAAGQVDYLAILGGNPVYDAYADQDLGQLVAKARGSVYLGPCANETARPVDWFVPEAHLLESWGDGRAFDGTVSFAQPLIAPLFGGRTVDEVLAVFLGQGAQAEGSHALLRDYWRGKHGATGFDAFWESTVRRGLMDRTAIPTLEQRIAWGRLQAAVEKLPASPADALEIQLRGDPRVYDGRFANNAWLLELPDPVTQLSWDNAALLSAATMTQLGVQDEDVLELSYEGRSIRVPVLAAHGQADGSLTLSLGYGRKGELAVGRDVGVNAYALRTSLAPYANGRIALTKTGEQFPLARAQLEFDLHGREDDIFFHESLEEYRKDPRFTAHKNTAPETLYDLKPGAPRQWGMSIDLGVCTGCSACVVACQAENNVPVVGREGVRKGRRMHWLRVDRYEAGEEQLFAEPMLCQHCEKAPCEYVCPVNATNHSADGLNQMVYNRCVGTRFCSNNCPYKVRRFNFFNYTDDITPLERLVLNPDVTVRDRGVMEKCSYCVQRIREAEIHAGVEARAVRDGDIRTACEQACPTKAIVFGNVADAGAEVTRLRHADRSFAVLNDLGTVPRTRYLARIRNPNPELAR